MAATQFEIDNALMAGRAYFDTRASINRFPVPQGWVEFKHRALDSGFEAISFQRESNPNEIVISYAGTGPGLLPGSPGFVDWIANSELALGSMSSQLVQAALYYLEVKADNPGATISFTGHSLGGGLAALMAVFFDEQAVTFDQAPFENSSSSAIRDELEFFLNGYGYSDAVLTSLVPEFMSYTGSGTRTANVTGYYVEGEALQYPPVSAFDTIGTQTMLPQHSIDLGLVDGPIDLHSQTLLTAFLLNDAFRAITYQLPDLLKTLFDEGLYAYKTTPDNTTSPNFLENLLRHQTGVAADPTTGAVAIPADGMLDRFVVDLQKVTPDTYGTASGTGMAEALVVAAMEYRYFKDAAGATQLFTFADYGLHFKYSDIGVSSYKSLPKLVAAVNAFLAPEELALLNGKLVKQDAWHIQSGVGGMILHAGADNDAVIGGTNADGLWGGAGSDILLGGANNDVLVGEAGNDFLLGGIGYDTYVINPGDEIRGSDGDDFLRFADYTGTNTVERIDGGGGYNRIVSGAWFGNLDFNTTELVNIARIEGSAGNNQITGSAGDDTLWGAGGSDQIAGGLGNDTYILGRGDGKDTIVENDATAGNTDIAQFLSWSMPWRVSPPRRPGDQLAYQLPGCTCGRDRGQLAVRRKGVRSASSYCSTVARPR